MAQKLDTEIISADSRQIYKYLNIGTAKPSPEELSQVKHHLLDIITPDQSYNAGIFEKQAGAIIQDIALRGKIPIVCGGSGLYVKALLEGLFRSDVHDPEIRKNLEQELEDKGLACLFAELQKSDTEAAAKISNNDKQRILRALEVFRATGIPMSTHWKNQTRTPRYHTYKIYLYEDRPVLYERINRRITRMLKDGLLDEIKNVLEKGYNWSDPGFNSVGYKEFQTYFQNGLNLEYCTALAQQHTRNYAKRQLTWYRKCIFDLADKPNQINIKGVAGLIRNYFQV